MMYIAIRIYYYYSSFIISCKWLSNELFSMIYLECHQIKMPDWLADKHVCDYQ